MKARWNIILIPPMIVSLLFLFGTQFVFLRAGFFEDLGLGRVGDTLTLENYITFFQDSFYFDTLRLSFYLSLIVVVAALLCAYPVAYVIARMRSHWSMILLATVVISSFITVVIKALGLIIIFGTDGPINSVLLNFALVDRPIKIIGNISGVVIGLMNYVLGFMILMLFSVIQTIPRSLEEAAEIHGSSRWRVFYRVVIPLSLPGVFGGSMIVFNLCMGAFVSAALLGGGRVLTLPVVIERTIVLDGEYAMGGALSAILLIVVLIINILSVMAVGRMRTLRT
jgi:putative spermidine/putrescine transport system permease protein|tara:strand:+ start:2068 stop:2913 length:846 start_codon:yes stop_codon:yes gene_type:complete